jgi:genome maintenance exonuclease 1
VDCIAEYNGKLSIIDFKTASKPKRREWISSYFMQCAAYAIMYEEMTGIPVTQLVVLIAVEDEAPQVFIEKRNDWAKPLIAVRKRFGGY